MRKFAVFDIDGTLIRWQLYHEIVNRLAQAGKLDKDSHDIITRARMAWKRRETTESFHAYEQVLVHEFETTLTKTRPEEVDALAVQVIDEYKDQVYTYTRDLIHELHQKEYVLLAISGSHHELIEKIAAHYGFDDFIATDYERTATGFTGNKSVPSFDKKTPLQSLIAKHQLTADGSYAIGDSLSDASMLEMVENPIAFNPDQKLYQAARSHGWKIVIERKNVIYTLEKQNGMYTLT